MDSLQINVVNKTQKGVVHAQVTSSGDDLGLLYLTEDQYITLTSLLRTGCFNKEVDFTVVDPYNTDDEEDLHPLFTID